MKKLLLTSVAGVALIAAGSANAADLGRPVYKAPPPVAPPVPVFSWTGCYVGGHVGWGWGRPDAFNHEISSGGLSAPPSTKIDTSGAIFGGQVGCDYQFGIGKAGGLGAWVIGIQGSLAAADINGVGPDPFDPTDPFEFIHVKTEWIGDVTARLGFTGWFPQTLFYVKGGGAWKRDRFHFAPDNEEQAGGFFTHGFSGWTVGGGIEWAFAPNWSAFVEYDHYDFGNRNVQTNHTRSETIFALDIKQTIETVKVGINYRLNWGKGKAPVVARY